MAENVKVAVRVRPFISFFTCFQECLLTSICLMLESLRNERQSNLGQVGLGPRHPGSVRPGQLGPVYIEE